jgi:hypothetical protein
MLVRTLIALACLALPLSAHAQTQVKPYFLVIFDTSGSMNDLPAVPNTCGFTTATTSMGTTTTASRKMDAAKCALGKLLNSTGDADFGLMQFAQSASCGNGSSCGPTTSSAQLRVPIETNTAGSIMSLIDKAGAAPSEELCSGGYTPLGGTLVAAKEYFEEGLSGFAAPTTNDEGLDCRPLSVILLTDGIECCNDCDDDEASSIYVQGCPDANAEITASGLAACPSGASNGCYSFGSCGGDSAFESAPQKAWELRNESVVPSASGDVSKTVRTYVIGFGLSENDPRIERIAIGGGTDNPSDGPDGLRAFYAQDEAALSLAFSQIIADAQPPTEVCNDLDDDCDTLIDEGFQKYCTPGASRELTECEEPDELLCDGIDDDCDGIIDEGTMNECGACGDETPDEVCDGFDNDCDGNIDEGTSGGACGSDEGECEAGELTCVDGMLECVGLVGPEPEQCNGKDDDCDGTVDEDPSGVLCPDGRCVAGECLPFCEITEFDKTCNSGRDPEVQPNGECLCVNDNCDDMACEGERLTRMDGDDEILLCAPDEQAVAQCGCRAGLCTHVCDGVICAGDDEVCDPRRGICALNDCRGLGCAQDELCDVAALECVVDPCASTSCDDGEVCRDGSCEASCADVDCDEGERCTRGRCVTDRCFGVGCDDDERCNPTSGQCEEDECEGVMCGRGLQCAPESGECERDACFAVRCPAQQGCRQGECVRTSGIGEPIPGNAERFLATGGGGCACSVLSGAEPRSSHTGLSAIALVGFALLVLARGRRRFALDRATSQRLLLLALFALASVLGGCKVAPVCVNCVSPAAGSGSGGGSGIGGPGGFGGSSGNGGDSGAGTGGSAGAAGSDPDAGGDAQVGDGGCIGDGIPEECNGLDDDCDFRVDEGPNGEPRLEALVNNCRQEGLCGGAKRLCVAPDTFECEYPSGYQEDVETLCDGIDEDCDGDVDEDFAELGDKCALGVGACAIEGQLDCNGAGTGVVCTVGEAPEPGDETCDGLDNDCDGLVDEPESEPGTNESYVRDALVQVAASVWMYKFEASRPDASDDGQGINAERACSRQDVLPWTNLSYDEAVEACEAADMELCSEAAWVDACNSSSNSCAWGFTPSGGACSASYPDDRDLGCNGHDLDAQPGDPDTDALAPTGAYERCYAAQMGGGEVFDLSGNAKEWVTDDPAVGEDLPDGSNPHRGGSYNNLPGGMRCDFAFAAANDEVRLRNVGFRCCTNDAP